MNRVMLEDKIRSSGVKYGAIARELGICETSFRNKRNGTTRFTDEEMVLLARLLHLSVREQRDIFLT